MGENPFLLSTIVIGGYPTTAILNPKQTKAKMGSTLLNNAIVGLLSYL